jgi:hypothetical protein
MTNQQVQDLKILHHAKGLIGHRSRIAERRSGEFDQGEGVEGFAFEQSRFRQLQHLRGGF